MLFLHQQQPINERSRIRNTGESLLGVAVCVPSQRVATHACACCSGASVAASVIVTGANTQERFL